MHDLRCHACEASGAAIAVAALALLRGACEPPFPPFPFHDDCDPSNVVLLLAPGAFARRAMHNVYPTLLDSAFPSHRASGAFPGPERCLIRSVIGTRVWEFSFRVLERVNLQSCIGYEIGQTSSSKRAAPSNTAKRARQFWMVSEGIARTRRITVVRPHPGLFLVLCTFVIHVGPDIFIHALLSQRPYGPVELSLRSHVHFMTFRDIRVTKP
jgi:hypothetical protein